MKTFGNTPCRYFLWPILAVCSLQIAWAGPFGVYQRGTVVRMHMGDCLPSRHALMVTMSGSTAPMGSDVCPEYTLVSDKVVYVIVGRSAEDLVPLADVIDFRLRKNEIAVRLDDARHESKFSIKDMMLRSEWEMVRKHVAYELSTPESREDSVAAGDGRK